MKRFWKRGDGLERELRSQRPEPRMEFLRALESRMSGDRYRRPARSLRVGLVGALTVAMLVSLAAFGGLGYAATGVSHAVTAATHVVAPAHKSAPAKKAAPARPAQPLTSAQVQYLVTMCFHGHTIRVDSHAVRILERLGATIGACGGERTPPVAKTVVICIKGQNVRVTRATAKALIKSHQATRGSCKKK
jgi:hypothetical protein